MDASFDLNNLIAIGIVGAGLSLLMEMVPSSVPSKYKKGIVIIGAGLTGWAYTALKNTAVFPTIIQVLMSAQTIYALFLKKDTVAATPAVVSTPTGPASVLDSTDTVPPNSTLPPNLP